MNPASGVASAEQISVSRGSRVQSALDEFGRELLAANAPRAFGELQRDVTSRSRRSPDCAALRTRLPADAVARQRASVAARSKAAATRLEIADFGVDVAISDGRVHFGRSSLRGKAVPARVREPTRARTSRATATSRSPRARRVRFARTVRAGDRDRQARMTQSRCEIREVCSRARVLASCVAGAFQQPQRFAGPDAERTIRSPSSRVARCR